MGCHLNRLEEPVFIAVSKPLLTEFGIHHRLESCVRFLLAYSLAMASSFSLLKKFHCRYGFVKSRHWKSKSKSGARLLLDFC